MELVTRMRHRMQQGEAILGTFVVELHTAALPRLLQQNRFDFMVIDTEHGCFDPAAVARLIDAGKRWRLCPLVRVPGPERAEIKRVLDAGAEGVMVPMCETVDEVVEAVSSSKYPPLGRRGAHFTRPHTNFDTPGDMGAYMAAANSSLLTIIQIETPGAAQQLDAIAALPGVDMLYLGPGDLSIALGYPGQITHPEVMAVVGRLTAACRKHGKLAGCHFADPAVLPQLRAAGVSFVGYGAEIRMLQAGIKQMGEAARRALSGDGAEASGARPIQAGA
jgi:2-keto-3-deoxy-L-rhamnonate aldolase RhmA